MVRPDAARTIDDRELDGLRDLLDQDPVVNCTVAARVEATGLKPRRLDGEMWGVGPRGAPTAACFSGANLIPVGADPQALAAFGDRALRAGRRCSSIVGLTEAVLPLWSMLEPYWGPARAIRASQPLLATREPSRITPDPAVRPVRLDQLDVLLPACVAMFTEEVGVSPIGRDGGALYRARVRELIMTGRAFARIEDGQVIFKAEIGALSLEACQVQGVWVNPRYRGRGFGQAGMAAVVEQSLRDMAPAVSLYVNDFNAAARAVYARVGFTQVGSFTSVMF
ncbi:MAG TPA: GNAT family N-acetyltransferase [Mycobacteriales bacterium]|nr:GNAT family N-acetyltransferase [Mycobacteriales bacterium]